MQTFKMENKSVPLYELTEAQPRADHPAAEPLSAGRRLSVRTTACNVPAALGAGVGRAKLHLEDAAALVQIAVDADRCAMKLSELQEWAHLVSNRSN
jgi:hypothetical protein